MENPFSALLPFYSFFRERRRRNGKEVVSQDNELRRDERWTRGARKKENFPPRYSLFFLFVRSGLSKPRAGYIRFVGTKRPIYLIVENLHNGQLACHERAHPLLFLPPQTTGITALHIRDYSPDGMKNSSPHRLLLTPLA